MSGPQSTPALLLVVHQEPVLALISARLRGELPVLAARSVDEALAHLARGEVGVVIADHSLPGTSGTELLAEIGDRMPTVVRIVLTTRAEVDDLLEAIESGRVDQFILKPPDSRELAVIVRRAIETHRLRAETARLLADNARLAAELRAAHEKHEVESLAVRREVGERYRLRGLIGASAAMHEVFRVLEKASQSSAAVLLTGETGTGKDLAAGCIHYNSPRKERKFVVVNCGSMPETLLETELFGHVKGAFTGALRDRHGFFEEADGGTIFLDEISEMSPAMQAELLRVVEDGLVRPVGGSHSVRVDVRLVTATNRNLKADAEAGRFRRDLFYRLDVLPITLPPLRARAGDVALLAHEFLQKFNAETGKRFKGFTPAALRCLEGHLWPGNVRELKNEIERAVALAEPSDAIDFVHLSPEVSGNQAVADTLEVGGKLRDRLQRTEQLLILHELCGHGDNHTQTARALGISLRSLQKKIKKYELMPDGRV